MEFRKIRALRGPNLWTYSPALEAYIDLKERKDTSSAMIAGYTDRLMAWLPGLIEHQCSEGHRGGFLVRLKEGTYPAHILEHVALELQGLAGTPVGYGRARVTPEEGVYRVVIKSPEEAVGRACLETARRLVLAAMDDQPFDVAGEVRRLRAVLARTGLGAAGAAVVRAARARGIPAQRVDDSRLVRLGQGARQRRFRDGETDRTSAVGAAAAKDTELTRALLKAAGVPVPDGWPVESVKDAQEAARDLGTPVVIKPQDVGAGRGVSLRLTTPAQVAEAFDHARRVGRSVVVERQVEGDRFRLLVVGGRLVASARRDPPGSAAEPAHDGDDAPGRGAVWIDVTDRVHPEVAASAGRAARALMLDVAGLDVVAHDLERPPCEGGMTVVGVHSGPDLRVHLEPDEGEPRPVAEAVLDTLFPPGDDGRIPVAAVTGVNGKTTVTRLIAHVLRGTGRCVGMTCTDGLYIGDRRVSAGDCSGPKSARGVLLCPEVEAAVLEAARGGILREGLGFDRCAVGVVTNIGEGDHLGLNYVMTVDDLVKVKRVVVECVLPTGWAVLNAADPRVVGMAGACRGGIIYFANDGDHPVVRAHRDGGGRVAFVRDGSIVLAEGAAERELTPLSRVPLTREGRIGFQVENALSAAAACWGLGVPFETVAEGFATFDSTPDAAPGRFNVLDVGGATVIVDFGHNPSAMEALADSLGAFEGRRRTVVLSADGDRSDEVIARQAEILAPAVDRVILYEEPARNRGRAPGEVPALLRRGLDAAPRPPEVEEVFGEEAAIVHALNGVEPGDVLLIIIDAVETSLPLVRRLLDAHLSPVPAER